MKQMLNSFRVSLACVFTISLFFISCQEESNEMAKSSRTLLASMSNYRNDGTLVEKETYKYDSEGRLIEMLNNNNYKVVIEYSANRLTMKEYDKGTLSDTEIFNLNDKGLYISSPSDDNSTTTYTYDSNGYRQSLVESSEIVTYKQTYIVSNGNYVTIKIERDYQPTGSAIVKIANFFDKSLILKSSTMKIGNSNMLKSAALGREIEKYDFTFYTDKINTIEYENMGIYFFGKQNKNLIKELLTTRTFDEETFTSTTTYTYEYDNKGRVTRQTEDNGHYNVFTYIN